MPEGIIWLAAGIAGITAGLIPFFVAQSRHKMALAWGALIGCFVLGLVGGALLAAPACLILTIVAFQGSASAEKPTPLNYWAIAIPAGLLLWMIAFGLVSATLPPAYISGKITVPLTMIALVLGGYIASGVTWFANRETADSDADDIAARISSLGDSKTSQDDKEN